MTGLRGRKCVLDPNLETSLARGVSSGEHDRGILALLPWLRGGVVVALAVLGSSLSKLKSEDDVIRRRGDRCRSMEAVRRIACGNCCRRWLSKGRGGSWISVRPSCSIKCCSVGKLDSSDSWPMLRKGVRGGPCVYKVWATCTTTNRLYEAQALSYGGRSGSL